ncbi:MAG TPA: GntR family transcriptional regulator [Firmicutes bacterium]|nr:GntR family transcriptional regulator [Candidatus Fermentithermobacillaceae bacterium]
MLIVLDNSSPVPLYKQIVEQIRARILKGELQPGEPLPSIRQLASDLLTSVITTKRAYQELEAEGLIQTRPGLGTFVAEIKEASLEEIRLKEVEARLRDIVRDSARLGIGATTLRSILDKVIEAEGLMDE